MGGRLAGNVGDGVHNLIEEKCSLQLEVLIESEDIYAAIGAREMFCAESSVRVGNDIALPKRAIEFVQGGRAEGSVDRSGPRNIGSNPVPQGHTRTEGIIVPVGKIDTRRGTR